MGPVSSEGSGLCSSAGLLSYPGQRGCDCSAQARPCCRSTKLCIIDARIICIIERVVRRELLCPLALLEGWFFL